MPSFAFYGDRSPLPPAHAQTSFALTRQADLWSAESGERVRVRGMRCVTLQESSPRVRLTQPSPREGEG
ncbi:hypothetical protein FZ983_07350 [Azospirillum sp. B21]|nr:hypothetical protein FZ983_07350 [Azospirillum sp. B21]